MSDWRDLDLPQSEAFRRAILAIPAGRVSTYGRVAEAAGYPRHHRAVARLLRTDGDGSLPWHRVVGADGRIKVAGASAHEQRARLRMEKVRVENDTVDLARYLHSF